MAPFKSTGGFSVGKLLGVFRNRDLTLNSNVRTDRYVEPPLVAKATGGTLIPSTTAGNGYFYHVFITPSPFVVDTSISSAEILVVGGGGAGGDTLSGGGGAGGIAYATSVPLPATTYTVGVGTGGNAPRAAAPAVGDGNPGFISRFYNTPLSVDINGLGGGGAAYYTGGVPNPSGSDPGGSSGGTTGSPIGSATQPGATGVIPGGSITKYGNVGRLGSGTNGGGGGGAGAGAPPGSIGGAGQAFPEFPAVIIGPALPTSTSTKLNAPVNPIRTDFVSAVGPTGLYGGGGGGGSGNGGTGGIGGTGGGGPGGDGQATTNGEPGRDGTGGGGGGGSYYAPYPALTMGGGGNGIIIVRYQ